MDEVASVLPRMPRARDVLCGDGRRKDEQRRLEDRFFGSLCMPNGTYKTTNSGRLAAFDELLVRNVQMQQPVSVLDVGISSGVTTLELAERLRQLNVRFRLVGVDRYLCAKLIELGPNVDVLLTDDECFLQMNWREWTRPRSQGQGTLKAAALQLSLDAVARAALRFGKKERRLRLVASGLRQDTAIELLEHDICIFRPAWLGQFDVIRAANVLNLSYFSRKELQHIVRHLTRYLSDGGFLGIVRTDEETGQCNGTLFRRDASVGGMRRVEELGAGSEIAEIVDAVDVGESGYVDGAHD